MAKKTADSTDAVRDNLSRWASSGSRVGDSGVEREKESSPVFTLEISLRHLHGKWSEFSRLEKKALESMSKVIKLIQRSNWDNLAKELRQFGVKTLGKNRVSSHGKLGLLYPKGSEINDCIYCRLDYTARIYFARGDGLKLYMIAVDPGHKICKRR